MTRRRRASGASPGPAERPLDVAAIRRDFPALASGLAFFDAPGGTQTPTPVIEAIAAALSAPLANRGHGQPGAAQRRADRPRTPGRRWRTIWATIPPGIVFGRSATQLTLEFARTLARGWAPGDEVVVTRLDHDGNIRPWVLAAERVGATVRWVDFDPATAELDLDQLEAILPARTRLVAVTGASNLLGTDPGPPADRRAGAPGRGAAVGGRRPPGRPRPGRSGRTRRRRPRVLAVQVLRSAPRGAGRRPRPARRTTARTSCCRPPTPCPSGSSSAPCRTSCWPGPPRPWTTWPDSGTARTEPARLTQAFARLAANEHVLRTRLEEGLRERGATIYSRAGAADLDRAVRPAGTIRRAMCPSDWPPRGSTPRPAASTRSRPRGTSVWETTAPSGPGSAPYTDAGDVERLLERALSELVDAG